MRWTSPGCFAVSPKTNLTSAWKWERRRSSPRKTSNKTDGQFWNTVFEQPTLLEGCSWVFARDRAESAGLECWSFSKAGVAKIKQTSKQTRKPFLKYTKPINVSTTMESCSKMKNLVPQNSLEKLFYILCRQLCQNPLVFLSDSPFWKERMNFRQKIILIGQCISSAKLLFLHWESDPCDKFQAGILKPAQVNYRPWHTVPGCCLGVTAAAGVPGSNGFGRVGGLCALWKGHRR